jgi:hypothetical protein
MSHPTTLLRRALPSSAVCLCSAEFEAEAFSPSGRDALYYARVVEAKVETVNGMPFRIECNRGDDESREGDERR